MTIHRKPMPTAAWPLALLAFFLWTPVALAHAHGGEAGGFPSGLAHPISGLDHIAAMIAVGLWGAQLGAPALWLLPVTFPIVMALGGMLGLIGVRVPGVEIGIAVSGVLLGAAVLLERRPRLVIAAGSGGLFRYLPRACARHGAAARGGRPAL